MIQWYIPFVEVITRLMARSPYPAEMITLGSAELADLHSVNETNPAHVWHLPATAMENPGLGVLLPTPAGLAMYVVDGSHRAERCRQEGRRFSVQVLPAGADVAARLGSPVVPLYSSTASSCLHCRRAQQQAVFTSLDPYEATVESSLDGNTLTWYVPFAEVIIRFFASIRQPLQPRPLQPEILAQLLVRHQVDEHHLAHLPEAALDTPGILTTCIARNGQVRAQLIDGRHRAERCRRIGRPFSVYELDPNVSHLTILAINGEYQY